MQQDSEVIYLTHEARGAGGSIKPGVKSRFIGTEPQDHDQERLTEPAERAIARAKTVPSISGSSSTAVARFAGWFRLFCLGPGVSLAALASPQALCWRALRALLVNVSECVKYIISNSEVHPLSFAAERRGPQLRFRPAVSSRKQRASSAFVLTACGKYTYVFPS